MPEAVARICSVNMLFLKTLPNAQGNTCARVRTPFLKEHLRWLLLKCLILQKRSEREIDCLCCKEVDAILIASGKIRKIKFLWVTIQLLVTQVSLPYVVDEFCFCSSCSSTKRGHWVNLRFYCFCFWC